MVATLALSAAANVALAGVGKTADPAAAKDGKAAKAKAAAEDFEAVFLNSMFSQMFTAIDGEGPFGGGASTGVWRSFLTEEYSKSFAKAGGIGISRQVYDSLLAQQEARPTTAAPPLSVRSRP